MLEPGGEQRLDAGRDAEAVEAGGDPPAVLAAQPALLDQRGQQLLQEQGVAPGRPGDRAGGRLGQGEGEGLVRAGSAGGEQVEAVEAPVGQAGRTGAALVPAVADQALLADAGLILAPELDLGVRMRGGDLLELRPKPLF